MLKNMKVVIFLYWLSVLKNGIGSLHTCLGMALTGFAFPVSGNEAIRHCCKRMWKCKPYHLVNWPHISVTMYLYKHWSFLHSFWSNFHVWFAITFQNFHIQWFWSLSSSFWHVHIAFVIYPLKYVWLFCTWLALVDLHHYNKKHDGIKMLYSWWIFNYF